MKAMRDVVLRVYGRDAVRVAAKVTSAAAAARLGVVAIPGSGAPSGSLLASTHPSQALIHRSATTTTTTTESDRAAAFCPVAFIDALSTAQIGRTVLYAPVVTSTQTLMTGELFSSFPAGSLMIADEQTSGRGRGKNSWESHVGSVQTTFTVDMGPRAEHLVFAQYIVSMALVRGVRALMRTDAERALVDRDLRIKWPNDIYIGDRKVAGVICRSELLLDEQIYRVAVGLGINVFNRAPAACLLQLSDTAPLTREKVLAATLDQLEPIVAQLREHGFGGRLEREYTALWLHTDQEVEVDGGASRCRITGIAAGSGCLSARDVVTGELVALNPDGNSFDFFKGLIRRKL